MTAMEIWVVYCAPALLVVAGALMAWRNHQTMERARARDRAEAGKTAS